jgi:hypothetical protein
MPEEAIEAVCTPLQSGVALRLPPHSKKKLSLHSTVRGLCTCSVRQQLNRHFYGNALWQPFRNLNFETPP